MYSKTLITSLLLFCLSCNNSASALEYPQITKADTAFKNIYPAISAIPLPMGYHRLVCAEGSFGQWLREIHLKQSKTVYKFDGGPKDWQGAQFAVMDISTGNKDLQQCADAVMRLRAEYLFSKKRFDSIIFSDNDKHPYQFTKPYDHDHLMNYLQKVFGMCGTASLEKQLTQAEVNNIVAGNVFIRGVFPGHAVIVMDVAFNEKGQKICLLAQSFMPAQDMHVLKNPVDNGLSPWILVTDKEIIETPEYTFRKNELKQW
ncbi:MAG: DUF4846 domain-containing protein [Ferruginibacter sp.]